MKILLTGATGYIGKRLLPELLMQNHEVVCLVRDKNRFLLNNFEYKKVNILEADLLNKESLQNIPSDIDVAYYLVHSMSSSSNYQDLEIKSAQNFKHRIEQTNCKQVIFLSGIINENSLSKHLASRSKVENILSNSSFSLTTLRAGIIIGSGSASFEIIRDLVEKLPIMITPIWLKTKCQPVAIKDVILYLLRSLMKNELFDKSFDIGGPDILSYKDMLLGYAKVRGISRKIFVLSVMTPRISSYWLYFITSTSYKLAVALVDSMKVEVICKPNNLNSLLNINPIGYEDALKRTFSAIQENQVLSSWKDALISGEFENKLSDFVKVPEYGCFKDKRIRKMKNKNSSIEKIWKIGGANGWYAADYLWRFRGFIDKVFGGVGLRRGRTSPTSIKMGDALDFWRVLYADKKEGRLLLFAEMKLPGEAWLEFRVSENKLIQTATFRPKGIWGRLYWYSVLPFHHLIFSKMLKRICE